MGDMSEYYDERTDDDTYDFEDHERPKPTVNRRKAETIAAGLTAVVNYYPKTDEEVKKLITSLDHWEWTTTKARKYSVDPYRLYADFKGSKHIVHIPGRYGSSLSWLKVERDKRLHPERVVTPVTTASPPQTEHGVSAPQFPYVHKTRSRGVVYNCTSDFCDYSTGLRKEQAKALDAINQHVATKSAHKAVDRV